MGFDLYDTHEDTFARRGKAAHSRLGSSLGITLGMVGLDLYFPSVALDLVSDLIWC